jgi:hypothetical protein
VEELRGRRGVAAALAADPPPRLVALTDGVAEGSRVSNGG